jgi:hypothetical protein
MAVAGEMLAVETAEHAAQTELLVATVAYLHWQVVVPAAWQ